MSAPRPAPAWLEAYQARFSAMLRTPLDRSRGSLRAMPGDYPKALCAEACGNARLGPAERLAAYNRQHWFRLFTVLQHEHPLTTRLVGAWQFNDLAARFLAAHPPREHDLACAADGFARYLEAEVPSDGIRLEHERQRVPKRMLVQAARIDDAFRNVFRAPEQPALRPSAEQLATIAHARLQWSRAVCLVEESWPLLELRGRLANADSVDRPIALPEPLAAARQWMICRTRDGFRSLPLEPDEAALMRLLEAHPLDDALAALEHAAPADARPALAQRAQRWFAQGMHHGYWTGIAP